MKKIFTQKERNNFLTLTLLGLNENGYPKAVLKSCGSRLQVPLTRKYYLLF